MYVFKQIDPNSIYITPFKAHKEWTFSGSNYTDYGVAIYSGTYEDSYYDLQDPSASSRDTTADNKYEYLIHYSQNHLFYADDAVHYDFSEMLYNTVKRLSTHIKVVSIPQFIYGEKIRNNSVNIYNSSHPWDSDFNFSTGSIADDGCGNLIDVDVKYQLFDTGPELGDDLSKIITKWDFDSLYPYSYNENKLIPIIKNVRDLSIYNNIGTIYNGRFERVNNANGITDGLGTVWNIYTESYARFPHNDIYNFHTNDNFAIAALVRIPTALSQDGYILVKGGGITASTQKDGTYSAIDNVYKNAYPFAIKYIGSGIDTGKIVASRYDGNIVSQVTSSATFNDDSFHFIVFSKSGSQLTLGVDNTVWSGSDSSGRRTDNFSDIFIGCYGSGSNHMTGSIKSIKIYNDYVDLTNSKIASWSILEKNGLDSYYIGNSITNYGFLTITNQAYDNLFKTSGAWTIEIDSTKTIYEYEIICTAESSEFNISTNPSIRYQDSIDNEYKIQDKFTSSYFNPYVTTIGLYDDTGELLIVGKVSSPIKKPINNTINFIVNFDI